MWPQCDEEVRGNTPQTKLWHVIALASRLNEPNLTCGNGFPFLQREDLGAIDPNHSADDWKCKNGFWLEWFFLLFSNFKRKFWTFFCVPVSAGHMEPGPLPCEHLQQLTKLLCRQKRRVRHGANFRACLRPADDGSTKDSFHSHNWGLHGHGSVSAGFLVWIDVMCIEAGKEGSQSGGFSLWPKWQSLVRGGGLTEHCSAARWLLVSYVSPLRVFSHD